MATCRNCGSYGAAAADIPCPACCEAINKAQAANQASISRAEYDRLLDIEGEYQRLLKQHAEVLELLKDLVDACDGNYRELTDIARAIIKRVEGGE